MMTVRVPLDYYRILMLSPRADKHQIEQAYQERRELRPGERSWLVGFSPQAVEARAQLVQEAASVLLDPEARRSYDEHLTLAHPTLTVDEALLPGVLCLCCEVGEYPAALSLAQQMLDQGHPARSDAILGRAVARLELGREAWRQGAYEEAAHSLQTGLVELEECQAFPQLQAELRIDLGKLRPYRILQLLDPNAPAAMGKGVAAAPALARQQGLALLKAMLDERGGIEGGGQDGSGLSTEDFLRFIQRVRRYLTLQEQQELFEQEAERPSLVAAYLAAQVLLTAGYVEKRPALVRRARGYLVRLAQRQDVHLEQAICSLLLGQTEEALGHLRASQETEALQFIEEHSAGSPDQLPGLCRFTEKWFQEEVFPEFYALDPAQASLKAYFDNPQVQAYLDEMPSRESSPAGTPSPPPTLPLSQPPAAGGANHPPAPFPQGVSQEPSHLPKWPAPWDGEPASSPLGEGSLQAYKRGLQEVERHHRSHLGSRRSRPERPAPSLHLRLAAVVGGGILSLVVSWQILRSLFTPPPPLEQPQVQLEQPPVALENSDQAKPSPEPELIGPLAEWQGVQQVRVISNDGINIRQQPSLSGAIVGTAPRQALLRVVEVRVGEGQVPVWLRVEQEGAPGGWVAAQSGSTRLVERL
jgi:hypothetical protein